MGLGLDARKQATCLAIHEFGVAGLYDHHYDALAEVMNLQSVWLAPPGSMP